MPSKQHSFQKFLQQTLFNRVSYLSDQLYALSGDGIKPLPATSGFRPVLILARQHYREELVWYPIVKLADVKKLVQLKLASQTTPVLVSFGVVVNNQTPVSYFYPQTELGSYNPWFILPETLLLAANKAVGAVFSYQSLQGQAVFVARTPAAVVSSLQGGVIKELAQFAMAHGLSADENAEQVQLNTALLPSFKALSRLPWSGLRNRFAFARSGDNKKMLRFGSGTLIITTLYLLASYQWSAYLLENARTDLQQASAQANQVLTERETLLQLKQRYQQLTGYIPPPQDELLLWQLLAPLYENQVLLRALEQKGNEIRIEIAAPSATAALQLLLKQPQIANAGFDTPVRRRNDQEEVGIKFSLKADGQK